MRLPPRNAAGAAAMSTIAHYKQVNRERCEQVEALQEVVDDAERHNPGKARCANVRWTATLHQSMSAQESARATTYTSINTGKGAKRFQRFRLAEDFGREMDSSSINTHANR